MTFFDILEDILLKKSNGKLYLDPEFNKAFSGFMIARYLSMRESLLPFAIFMNKLNSLGSFSNEQKYIWAYKNIPKQKNSWIKYISKKKKDEKTN